MKIGLQWVFNYDKNEINQKYSYMIMSKELRGLMELSSNEFLAPMAIEKIKILVAVFGATIHREKGPIGLNWQCCLAGSSKTAPMILFFQ